MVDSLHAKGSPLRAGYQGAAHLGVGGDRGAGFTGAQHRGTGSFVSHGAPMTRVTPSGGNNYDLNLVNAPIAEAAKAVLGDALQVNYVVDPRVQGTVTLQTSRAVSRDTLVDILESALR